jgi:cell division protein FtsZ
MKDMGLAVMGTGRASGADRARKATLSAISSPLLENVSINGAKGVLLNVTGNVDLGLHEISEAATMIYEMVSEDANIILGSVIDRELGDDVVVTVIATGFDEALSTQTQEKVFKPVTESRVVPPMVTVTEKKPEDIEENVQPSVIEKPIVDESSTLVEQAIVHEEQTMSSDQAQSSAENISFEQALAALDQEQNVLDEQPKQTVKITEPIISDEKSVDMNDLDAPTFLRKKLEAEKSGKRDHKIVR